MRVQTRRKVPHPDSPLQYSQITMNRPAMASDAIKVDSTVMSLDQVIGLIVRVAGERGFPLAGHPARTG